MLKKPGISLKKKPECNFRSFFLQFNKISKNLVSLMAEFTVGLIGLGRIGKIHAENLCRRIPGVKVKTAADVNLTDELEQWAHDMGIENVTADASAIFDDPDINIVVIASSTNTHLEYIQAAAKAGKQIFCEKPIGTDIDAIKETLAVVKDAGVKLMIGFNRRFDHNFKRVHDATLAGTLGNVQIIKVTSRDPSPPPLEYVKVSGGLFLDMSIHDWDAARFQAGSEVDEVYATGDALVNPEIKEYDIDTAAAILKFKSGAIGIIDNCRQAVYGYDQRVEVFGSAGCAIADNDTVNTAKIYTAENTSMDKIPLFFLERYMGSYEVELKEFFACLREDRQPIPSGEDGLADVLVAFAAKKSLEENRDRKSVV